MNINTCLSNLDEASRNVVLSSDPLIWQGFLEVLRSNYNLLSSGDIGRTLPAAEIVQIGVLDQLNDEGLKTFIIAHRILNNRDPDAQRDLFTSSVDNGKVLLASKLIDLNLFLLDPIGAFESLKFCFVRNNYGLATHLFQKNRHSINLDARNNLGEALVHQAAKAGSNSLFDWLISNGADPFVVDHEGNTPLHVAARELYRLYGDEQKYKYIKNRYMGSSVHENTPNYNGLIPLKLRGTYFADSFERLISNANGLTNISNEGVFYEGLYPKYPLHRQLKDIYSNQNPELFAALTKDNLNPSEMNDLFGQIRMGDFKIVRTGTYGHAITVVFFKGYMAICDRGRVDIPTIFTHQINLNKLTLSDVQTICVRPENPQFFEELLGRLEAVQDNFCRKIALISNKFQRVGNCSMNIKGGLRAGAAYLSLKANADGLGQDFRDFLQDARNERLIDECLCKAKLYSKVLWCHFRETLLKEYMDDQRRILRTTMPVDLYLIDACQGKIQKHKDRLGL